MGEYPANVGGEKKGGDFLVIDLDEWEVLQGLYKIQGPTLSLKAVQKSGGDENEDHVVVNGKLFPKSNVAPKYDFVFNPPSCLECSQSRALEYSKAVIWVIKRNSSGTDPVVSAAVESINVGSSKKRVRVSADAVKRKKDMIQLSVKPDFTVRDLKLAVIDPSSR